MLLLNKLNTIANQLNKEEGSDGENNGLEILLLNKLNTIANQLNEEDGSDPSSSLS